MLLPICCLLAGCVTSASGPRFDALPKAPASANQARVYVFRSSVFYLAQAPYVARAPVLIDGGAVGTMTNGGFLIVDVVSGHHSITVTAATDQTTKGFDAAGGSEVYIQVYDKSRMEGVAPALAGGVSL
jgi:hypothetical protein